MGAQLNINVNSSNNFNFKENIMSIINQLWKQGDIPIINGIIYSDDTYQNINLDTLKKNIYFGEKGSLQNFLNSFPNFVSGFDKYGQINKADIYFEFGGGGHGSEGYLACLNPKTNKVYWIFFSQCINPIITSYFMDEDKLVTKSELGFELIFNISKYKFLNVEFN